MQKIFRSAEGFGVETRGGGEVTPASFKRAEEVLADFKKAQNGGVYSFELIQSGKEVVAALTESLGGIPASERARAEEIIKNLTSFITQGNARRAADHASRFQVDKKAA